MLNVKTTELNSRIYYIGSSMAIVQDPLTNTIRAFYKEDMKKEDIDKILSITKMKIIGIPSKAKDNIIELEVREI
jgi:hypothetical protein